MSSPVPPDDDAYREPTPPTYSVPDFPPVRIHGRRRDRLLRHHRRAVAAGLAVTAAALIAGVRPGDIGRERAEEPGPGPGQQTRTGAAPAHGQPGHVHTAADRAGAAHVSAPVRIADAAAVRLLRPGDRVDVIATGSPEGADPPGPRVVAAGVRVLAVPEPDGDPADTAGALVVLSVPRLTATRLAGAGAAGKLAVTLW
jgi:hypothetical protein